MKKAIYLGLTIVCFLLCNIHYCKAQERSGDDTIQIKKNEFTDKQVTRSENDHQFNNNTPQFKIISKKPQTIEEYNRMKEEETEQNYKVQLLPNPSVLKPSRSSSISDTIKKPELVGRLKK